MKKLMVLILSLAVISAGGCILYGKLKKQKVNGSQSFTVTKGTIRQTVEATGTVSPLNRVEIKPPMAGRIEELLAGEGDSAKAGQILAWMSSSDRAAILDAAISRGPDQLKYWQESYKPSPVVAPLSGVIILKNVVVGQTVNPSDVLFAMSDFLIVLAQVDESDIGRIKVGMPARITLDAYPAETVQGAVSDILHEGKNVSNVITYGVKVRLARVPSFFRSQMTANISFIVNEKKDVLLLPVIAVKDMTDGTKSVSLPENSGGLESRGIITGIESNDKIEVISGLSEGDKVFITRPKYSPQRGAQSSPLALGGSRPANGGQAQGSRKR